MSDAQFVPFALISFLGLYVLGRAFIAYYFKQRYEFILRLARGGLSHGES